MPNPKETTKTNARTKDVPLESSSPTGHDEIGSQIAKEALGDGAADRPPQPKPEPKPVRAHEENPKGPTKAP